MVMLGKRDQSKHQIDFDYASLPSETKLVSVLADTHIETLGDGA
jgi:hypothetical protein